MQLIVNIQNDSIAHKIISILNVFKDDGVEVNTIDNLKDNQKNIQEYDVDYEKSFQCKLDRAEFVKMKENI